MNNDQIRIQFLDMFKELTELADTVITKGGKAINVASSFDGDTGGLVFRLHVSPTIGDMPINKTPLGDDRVVVFASANIEPDKPLILVMYYNSQPQFAITNSYALDDSIKMASDLYMYLFGKPADAEYRFHMPPPPMKQ